MFSLEELFLTFVIAIAFIYIFKLHKELFPGSYWATSDIISETIDPPSQKSIIIRFLMILLFGIISNFFFIPKIIIFGITLGSFLIVWPIFLSDENIEPDIREHKLLLRTFLAVFVFASYVTANLSIVIFNICGEIINIYLQELNSDRIINLIADSLIWTVFIIIFKFLSSYIRKSLDNKVSISPYLSYEESESNAYKEIVATEEPRTEDEDISDR